MAVARRTASPAWDGPARKNDAKKFSDAGTESGRGQPHSKTWRNSGRILAPVDSVFSRCANWSARFCSAAVLCRFPWCARGSGRFLPRDRFSLAETLMCIDLTFLPVNWIQVKLIRPNSPRCPIGQTVTPFQVTESRSTPNTAGIADASLEFVPDRSNTDTLKGGHRTPAGIADASLEFEGRCSVSTL
jgi:hypothetical protein